MTIAYVSVGNLLTGYPLDIWVSTLIEVTCSVRFH